MVVLAGFAGWGDGTTGMLIHVHHDLRFVRSAVLGSVPAEKACWLEDAVFAFKCEMPKWHEVHSQLSLDENREVGQFHRASEARLDCFDCQQNGYLRTSFIKESLKS
jgi:hypothetical protein